MFPFDYRNTDLWRIAHRHRKEEFEVEAGQRRLAATIEAPILSRAMALRLCTEIRQSHRWYQWANWRCQSCMIRARKGVPGRLQSPTGFTGCCQVNRRYELASG